LADSLRDGTRFPLALLTILAGIRILRNDATSWLPAVHRLAGFPDIIGKIIYNMPHKLLDTDNVRDAARKVESL
jgi:hypothetical protein